MAPATYVVPGPEWGHPWNEDGTEACRAGSRPSGTLGGWNETPVTHIVDQAMSLRQDGVMEERPDWKPIGAVCVPPGGNMWPFRSR